MTLLRAGAIRIVSQSYSMGRMQGHEQCGSMGSTGEKNRTCNGAEVKLANGSRQFTPCKNKPGTRASVQPAEPSKLVLKVAPPCDFPRATLCRSLPDLLRWLTVGEGDAYAKASPLWCPSPRHIPHLELPHHKFQTACPVHSGQLRTCCCCWTCLHDCEPHSYIRLHTNRPHGLAHPTSERLPE